jgi:NAD(P)-dependent dehydrogenase (short-subunit alcohol dehydrogenase family)
VDGGGLLLRVPVADCAVQLTPSAALGAAPPLLGRVAVVTGGNRGIGRVTARALAGAGASVAVAARSQDQAEAVVRELEEGGADAAAFTCDVTDERSVEQLGDAVLGRFDHVDVVVANAGVAGVTRPMHEITYQEWRECEAVNVDGVFLTFRRFVPALLAQGSGSLVAISSITGKRPLFNRTPYATSKLAVIGLVRTLAMELGPHGIRVNSICPGAVAGERIDAVVTGQAKALGIDEDEVRRRFTDAAALQRFINPEEVAAAVVFLASDAASSITGEDLNVSAGLVMF